MNLHIVSEDLLSDAVSRKLFNEVFPDVEFHFIPNVKRGRGNVKNKVDSYRKAANQLYVFILVDLDTAPCAPVLLNDWLKGAPQERLIFRVAVREVESWLLADVEGLARFLGFQSDFVRKETDNPDSLADPKFKLLSLVNRCMKRDLINDIVRIENNGLKQGPAYNSRISEFVNQHWSVEDAQKRSDSLRRAVSAITDFRFH